MATLTVKTIHNPPYMSGSKKVWSLGKDEIGSEVFVSPYKTVTVAISGELAGASIGFKGGVADDDLLDIYEDNLTPFLVRKPGLIELPLCVSRLAPFVKGGTDETAATVTIFISEGA